MYELLLWARSRLATSLSPASASGPMVFSILSKFRLTIRSFFPLSPSPRRADTGPAFVLPADWSCDPGLLRRGSGSGSGGSP